MSHRLRKVNKHIERVLGEIIQKEIDFPPDVLVTISSVEAAPNLKSALVWLYVMPFDRGEEILELIKTDVYQLQGAFNKSLHMKQLPLLRFKLDNGADHAERIARQLTDLEE